MVIITAGGYVVEILQVVHIHFDLPSLHVADPGFRAVALVVFIPCLVAFVVIAVQVPVGRVQQVVIFRNAVVVGLPFIVIVSL